MNIDKRLTDKEVLWQKGRTVGAENVTMSQRRQKIGERTVQESSIEDRKRTTVTGAITEISGKLNLKSKKHNERTRRDAEKASKSVIKLHGGN